MQVGQTTPISRPPGRSKAIAITLRVWNCCSHKQQSSSRNSEGVEALQNSRCIASVSFLLLAELSDKKGATLAAPPKLPTEHRGRAHTARRSDHPRRK